jgi:predicted phosphodiesterase
VAYLILSDIHSNLEALEAVLADAEGRYDCILCLGDVVGYGADPNAVSEWVRAECAGVVRGNHDRAAANDQSLEYFNAAARASAIWTRRALTEENRKWLEELPQGPLRVEEPLGNFVLVHGSVADEDQYVVQTEEALALAPALEEQATFFGHTHLQGGFLLARGAATLLRPNRVLELEPDYFYLINPGSVGQPRDGDPRAGYVLFSIEERTVEYRRVPYNIDGAAAKIRAAGLPAILASRLYDGM